MHINIIIKICWIWKLSLEQTWIYIQGHRIDWCGLRLSEMWYTRKMDLNRMASNYAVDHSRSVEYIESPYGDMQISLSLIYIWCSGNWQSIISRNWTLQAKADLNAWSLFAEVMNFRFRYSKHKTFWCIRNWHCEATRANYNFCSVWKTMKSNKQKIKLQIHPLCRHYGNARFFHHHQQQTKTSQHMALNHTQQNRQLHFLIKIQFFNRIEQVWNCIRLFQIRFRVPAVFSRKKTNNSNAQSLKLCTMPWNAKLLDFKWARAATETKTSFSN